MFVQIVFCAQKVESCLLYTQKFWLRKKINIYKVCPQMALLTVGVYSSMVEPLLCTGEEVYM